MKHSTTSKTKAPAVSLCARARIDFEHILAFEQAPAVSLPRRLVPVRSRFLLAAVPLALAPHPSRLPALTRAWLPLMPGTSH